MVVADVMKLTKNKYVKLFVMALGLMSLAQYVTVKAWECLAIFLASVYSIHCYKPNVVLAVLGGLFVSNYVFGCGRVKENFELSSVEGAAQNLQNAINDKKEKEGMEGEDDENEEGPAMEGFGLYEGMDGEEEEE